MSECTVCGQFIGRGGCMYRQRGYLDPAEAEQDRDAAAHYRAGYERTLARADRYEAEFSACKALLIAEQKRAERAEAERAEAERKVLTLEQTTSGACDLYQAAEQRASEARALALEEAAQVAENPKFSHRGRTSGAGTASRIRALAALPVEPARRQVTDITQRDGDTQSAPVRDVFDTLRMLVEFAYEHGFHELGYDPVDEARQQFFNMTRAMEAWRAAAFREKGLLELAETAQDASTPAPQNPPPSPTGDAE